MADAPTTTTFLIVDDEPQIRRALRNALASHASLILEAGTGAEALDLAASQRPSLIVLDLGLPDMDGIRVCREIRSWSAASIIVLSVRHTEREKISLLDAGADDYMTKPFSTLELQARVRAHLRRAQRLEEKGNPVVHADGLEIDVSRRSIRKKGESVHLTPTEWDLLRTLVSHEGRTLTHRHLFDIVWPHSAGDPQQYLRVHVANLRRKLEVDAVRPRILITEPGVGYRFEIPR